MENRFKHLAIDCKKSLPEPWYDYTVLQSGQFETITIYSKGREHLKAYVGKQDGVWTAGSSYQIADHHSSYFPGRKWGQFESKDDALLYVLGAFETMLQEDEKAPKSLLKLVESEINKIRFEKLQLTLF